MEIWGDTWIYREKCLQVLEADQAARHRAALLLRVRVRVRVTVRVRVRIRVRVRLILTRTRPFTLTQP